MTERIPLATYEVRWFFEGNVDQHPTLKPWFETVTPFPKGSDVGPPAWRKRSDCYWLVPYSDDMGIKWREGELQIKGRIASLGTQAFCGKHQGKVERWSKWSYANLPAAYQRLFGAKDERELATVSVSKNRALRKIRLDTFTGQAEEVNAETSTDRGLELELTDLEVAGKSYCSIAFEAFPDDSALSAAFAQTTEAFLSELTFTLTAADSQSYPAWLSRISEL